MNTATAKKHEEVTYARVNELVLKMLEPPKAGWYVLLAVCVACVGIGAYSWTRQILNGIGESGKSHPISWGA